MKSYFLTSCKHTDSLVTSFSALKTQTSQCKLIICIWAFRGTQCICSHLAGLGEIWQCFVIARAETTPFESLPKPAIGQGVWLSWNAFFATERTVWTEQSMDRILISNGVCFKWDYCQPVWALEWFLLIHLFSLHLFLFLQVHFSFLYCLSAPCNTSDSTLPSHMFFCFSLVHFASHSRLPLSQCHWSLSLHLPPSPFMLHIGAAGCQDMKLVAPRLASVASFLWWHNVGAMSYALKQ